MMLIHRKFQIPLVDRHLPLFTETLGYNPAQEKIARSNGYPYYHWIQTVRGKGTVSYHDRKVTLPKNHGALFLPEVPHSYEKDKNSDEEWETTYLTFGGSMVTETLAKLDLNHTAFFHWEQPTPLSCFIEDIIKQGESPSDIFNIKASTDVYSFLLSLHKYGMLYENTSQSGYLAKLYPLIEWMKENISDEKIGVEEMANFTNVSKRHLNSLFQVTFNITPYTYFLNLRIQKAKKLLLNDRYPMTIKDISSQVGFRSPSHFIATFRKKTGLTPDKYRRMH